eukprot:3295830-Rhodomonas_salina.4
MEDDPVLGPAPAASNYSAAAGYRTPAASGPARQHVRGSGAFLRAATAFSELSGRLSGHKSACWDVSGLFVAFVSHVRTQSSEHSVPKRVMTGGWGWQADRRKWAR